MSSLQSVVSKSISSKLASFVKDMRGQVSHFIEEMEKKNELESVAQSVEGLKEEIERLKTSLTALPFAPCESELTEGDVDCFIQEKKLNELIIQVCKKQNQGMLLYALDQMENDMLYEIDAGLLMSLAYCVGIWREMLISLFVIYKMRLPSELIIYMRL